MLKGWYLNKWYLSRDHLTIPNIKEQPLGSSNAKQCCLITLIKDNHISDQAQTDKGVQRF